MSRAFRKMPRRARRPGLRMTCSVLTTPGMQSFLRCKDTKLWYSVGRCLRCPNSGRKMEEKDGEAAPSNSCGSAVTSVEVSAGLLLPIMNPVKPSHGSVEAFGDKPNRAVAAEPQVLA